MPDPDGPAPHIVRASSTVRELVRRLAVEDRLSPLETMALLANVTASLLVLISTPELDPPLLDALDQGIRRDVGFLREKLAERGVQLGK